MDSSQLFYEIKITANYKKKIIKLKRSGTFSKSDFDELQELIVLLAKELPLAEKYKDHALKGYKTDTREFHFRPDLLVKYTKFKGVLILALEDIANHGTMFG